MRRPAFKTIQTLLLTLFCFSPAIPSTATTAIALRSRYRVVLAADSRAIYGANRNATECKLFQIREVYATVSGLAHYGTSFRATDAVRDGFSRPGNFQNQVSSTAYFLQQRVDNLLAGLQRNNPNEYRLLMQRAGAQSDFVALAVAGSINGEPMLGIIELQRAAGQRGFVVKTAVCPGIAARATACFTSDTGSRSGPMWPTPANRAV